MFVSIAAQDYPTITELMLLFPTRARLRQSVPQRSNRLHATLVFQHSWSISHGDLHCGFLASSHVDVKTGSVKRTVSGGISRTPSTLLTVLREISRTPSTMLTVSEKISTCCVRGNLDNTSTMLTVSGEISICYVRGKSRQHHQPH